jgi:hypothetical protein
MKLTAQPALVGFLYQFQCSIMEVLECSPDDRVTFEGLQDLEIDSGEIRRSIQFKYLPSKTLCASTVRWPVLELLAQGTGDRERGKGGEEICELHIFVARDAGFRVGSIDDLKALGRYSDNGRERDYVLENRISDRELKRFLDSFRLVIGESLEKSYERVVRALAKKYCCTIALAEEYFYPRAIERCLKLATNADVQSRTVTASEFWDSIDGDVARGFVRKRMEREVVTGAGITIALQLLRKLILDL